MAVPFKIDLRGKTAVVTGGGGVLCSAFCEALAECGANVAVLDLTAGIGRHSFPPAQRELVLGQITELLTNYGEIPYFIIDGWNAPWGGPSYRELPFEEVDRKSVV